MIYILLILLTGCKASKPVEIKPYEPVVMNVPNGQQVVTYSCKENEVAEAHWSKVNGVWVNGCWATPFKGK